MKHKLKDEFLNATINESTRNQLLLTLFVDENQWYALGWMRIAPKLIWYIIKIFKIPMNRSLTSDGSEYRRGEEMAQQMVTRYSLFIVQFGNKMSIVIHHSFSWHPIFQNFIKGQVQCIFRKHIFSVMTEAFTWT